MHFVQRIMRLTQLNSLNNILKYKKNCYPSFEGFSKFLHITNDEMSMGELNHTSEYQEIAQQFLNPSMYGHGVLIIQPYIKWGKAKRKNTSPDLQLLEAEALVRTLPNWSVIGSERIPLMTFRKHQLFGRGNLEKLAERVKSNPKITAVFISLELLRPIQTVQLQKIFGVDIYDRYSIVIQIFREHAKTAEAKLQVAVAELSLIWKKIAWASVDSNGRINLTERRKMVLHARENKLNTALAKLKAHRKLIRSSRTLRNIPTIAVVGYTNAGKTCLIKALTDDESLVPQNKLFATLDTTSHEGLLPCRMKVLYMDTIGFIQDLPEELLEPFIATFEDAIIADVVVHVYDASHPDRDAQIQHVRETLNNIMSELEITSKPIIEVANKCDVAPKGSVSNDVMAVSALNLTGYLFTLVQIYYENELKKNF
ncbi:putative GTP-binding protein 6 isoform X2 [Chelonus insularis]|uniref:putative GTP-binding protein 6 isoform X2 n=1 Tax=Chelonus insularis TaxID=460826 RepID=UPI00158C26F4|nr:putative GTP-binding protein 6 isoform X2 [Chelonus insularis]